MVSINARVSSPKVVKNRAKKPVRIFCPKENISSIAHTTSGTFLKNAATILTIRFTIPLKPVAFEPNKLKQKANIAAITVTATDSRAVSISLSSIFGKRSIAFSSGMRLCPIHAIAFGNEASPSLK